MRISCSSGTYIRALARDLGKELGVGGYLTRLRHYAGQPIPCRTMPADLSLLRAMLDTRTHTVTAHTDQKTFTNREEGQTVTRNKCVLDLLKVLPVMSAATGCLTMPLPWNRPLEVRCRP